MFTDTLTRDFRLFMAERPAISPDILAKELGYNPTNLQKIIIGKRNIPNHRRGDFAQIMRKYGYQEKVN